MESLKNIVSQKVQASGIGAITLGAVIPGSVSFNQAYNDGETVFYSLRTGYNREVGQGTYNSSTGTVTRDVIFMKLDNGSYEEFPATPIEATALSVVTTSPSVQALIYHMPVWKRIHSNVDTSEDTHSPDNLPVAEFKTGSGILLPTFQDANTQQAPIGFAMPHDVVNDTDFFVQAQVLTSGAAAGTARMTLNTLAIDINGTAPAVATETKEFSISGVNETHQILEFAPISVRPGMLIVGTIIREGSHANDTYAGSIYLGGLSGVYQARLLGTPSKTPGSLFDWS